MAPKTSWFTHFAQAASHITGRPLSFIVAVAVIVVWAVTGPLFGYSDTWQLVINTGTTIVTFLMVFVIQNTQNRDTAAMHIKLDELIRVSRGARNVLLDLEELEDKDLEGLRREYERLAEKDRDKKPQQSPREAANPKKAGTAGRKKQT
jgi:low affinity Fe/Cu permease